MGALTAVLRGLLVASGNAVAESSASVPLCPAGCPLVVHRPSVHHPRKPAPLKPRHWCHSLPESKPGRSRYRWTTARFAPTSCLCCQHDQASWPCSSRHSGPALCSCLVPGGPLQATQRQRTSKWLRSAAVGPNHTCPYLQPPCTPHSTRCLLQSGRLTTARHGQNLTDCATRSCWG